MNIKKYEKKKNNQYKVYIDDDCITLYDDVILNNNLLLKKSITVKELDNIINENSYYDAYFKSIKYINKKLRSKKEIIKYLEKEYDKNIIDKAIDRLEKERYINDSIYVVAYIHDAVNLSNKGYYKIKKELIDLGINENVINNNLDDITDDVWQSKISNIINKKAKVNKDSVSKFKNKLNYELFNLGYSKEMINEVLENISIDDSKVLESTYNKLYKKYCNKYKDKELELQITNRLLNQGFNYDNIKIIINKNI